MYNAEYSNPKFQHQIPIGQQHQQNFSHGNSHIIQQQPNQAPCPSFQQNEYNSNPAFVQQNICNSNPALVQQNEHNSNFSLQQHEFSNSQISSSAPKATFHQPQKIPQRQTIRKETPAKDVEDNGKTLPFYQGLKCLNVHPFVYMGLMMLILFLSLLAFFIQEKFSRNNEENSTLKFMRGLAIFGFVICGLLTMLVAYGSCIEGFACNCEDCKLEMCGCPDINICPSPACLNQLGCPETCPLSCEICGCPECDLSEFIPDCSEFCAIITACTDKMAFCYKICSCQFSIQIQ